MARPRKLPPQLQKDLRRLERLRQKLTRHRHLAVLPRRVGGHVSGALGVYLVLAVVHDSFAQSFGWWSLIELAGAVLFFGGARSLLKLTLARG